MRLIIACVVITGVGFLCSSQLAAKAPKAPEAMAVRVFCSFADIHKMVNNRKWPLGGDEAREVRAWLKTAELLAASDDDYQELLSFYLAYGYAALGEGAKAQPLLEQLMADESDVNAPEAANVSQRLGLVEETIEGTRAHLLEQYYPAGGAADCRLQAQRKLRYDEISGPDGSVMRSRRGYDGEFFPKRSSGAMLLAGDLYVEMGMIEEGHAAYRRAAGFICGDRDFVKGVAGPIWTRVGSAYGRVGKWREALACHYKALASGEDLAKMLPAIQKARQGLQDKTVVQPPQRKPDATKLEQVARHCVATDLYEDALAAARAAAKVRGSENEALVKAIYRVKAWMYTEIIAACDEGVVYRGQKVTSKEFEEACRRGDWVPQRDRKGGYDLYESRPKVPGPASEPTSQPGKQPVAG